MSIEKINAAATERRDGLVELLHDSLKLINRAADTNPKLAQLFAEATGHELAHVLTLTSDTPPEVVEHWNEQMQKLGTPFDQMAIT